MHDKINELSHQDLQILQSALVDLYADVSQTTLPARTLRFAEKIIPDNFVSIDLFALSGKVERVLWSNFEKKPTEQDIQTYMRFAHENPLHLEVVVKKRLDPVILSDFIKTEDFLKTSIYKHFFSISGAKYMMAVSLWISSDSMMTCIFWNSRNDFSERDRLMLSFATPHLINAVRNASDFDHLTSALEIKNSGVLAINENGRIQYAGKFVRQIWGKYFDGILEEGILLPENLIEWVRKNESVENDFFEIKNSNGELSIRSITTDQTFRKTLLFEEKRTISAKTLEKLNLTKREAEVLFWMSQGKTDKDIAGLCKISHLTVHKHAQNIYIKLGVETRTAAMLRALEIL